MFSSWMRNISLSQSINAIIANDKMYPNVCMFLYFMF